MFYNCLNECHSKKLNQVKATQIWHSIYHCKFLYPFNRSVCCLHCAMKKSAQHPTSGRARAAVCRYIITSTLYTLVYISRSTSLTKCCFSIEEKQLYYAIIKLFIIFTKCPIWLGGIYNTSTFFLAADLLHSFAMNVCFI